MVEIATDVFEERMEPAEEAREDYRPIELEMDANQERIVVNGTEEYEDDYEYPEDVEEEEEEEEEAKREEEEKRDEMFTELLQMRLPELKEIAREFPRDVKVFGGWSGKNKTHLIQWIIQRRSKDV